MIMINMEIVFFLGIIIKGNRRLSIWRKAICRLEFIGIFIEVSIWIWAREIVLIMGLLMGIKLRDLIEMV